MVGFFFCLLNQFCAITNFANKLFEQKKHTFVNVK